MSKRKIDVQKLMITLTHEQLKTLAHVYLQNPDDAGDVSFLIEPTAYKISNWMMTEEEDARPIMFVG